MRRRRLTPWQRRATDESQRLSNDATGKLLAFTSVVEAGTGVVALLIPALLVKLLLGLETSGDGALLARCFGVALMALSLACWPGTGAWSTTALRGMLFYNAAIALYLGYLGAFEHLAGILLWPAVALHAVVAFLLLWMRRERPA
jgi:hypothetical protein